MQPVITAEEIAARRGEGLSCAAVDAKRDAVDIGGVTPDSGTTKRRRTGLMHAEASTGGTMGAQVPEPVGGTATRGKRKRTHRTAADAKRRREAAVAFDGTDSDEDGPAPAGPAPFSAPEVEEPDNPMNVG